MSRGNGGERIFRNDTDRRRFLGLMAELPERFSAELHAFVLMDNHYHLLRMDPRQQTAARRIPRTARPLWKQMVQATERTLGRPWTEMIGAYGDWGRDGLLAVATRHLGWRLAEVVREVPGLSYAAAAQGIRRFSKLAPVRPEMSAFAQAFRKTMSNG